MMNTNPKVDHYFINALRWREELEYLRTIVLNCQLTEELKWASPIYTWHGKNIVGLGGFKKYCVLAFFKGVLLSDSEKILVVPGKVQSGRMIRFTNVKEIAEMETVLKAYIFEAIEVEKAGLKVEKKRSSDFKIPEEFQYKLNEIHALKTAFEALTPGRQREYLLYFSSAKQAKTREARVKKCIQQILNRRGLNDAYIE